MDIRDLVRRHHTHAAPSSSETQPAAETSATAETSAADSSSASSTAAASADAQSGAATTQRVSGGGRFMHMLQAFEDKHPEEAKHILSGIADKLRADAQHAGPWAARLERWADKVQKAADTGDMSNLMPTSRPHAHFGVRAYQQAQEAPDASGLDHVAATADAQGSMGSAPAAGMGEASSTSTAPAGVGDTQTSAADSSSSSPSVTTPIIAGTPSATGTSSTSADATTPIIAGTPSATDASRMSA